MKLPMLESVLRICTALLMTGRCWKDLKITERMLEKITSTNMYMAALFDWWTYTQDKHHGTSFQVRFFFPHRGIAISYNQNIKKYILWKFGNEKASLVIKLEEFGNKTMRKSGSPDLGWICQNLAHSCSDFALYQVDLTLHVNALNKRKVKYLRP